MNSDKRTDRLNKAIAIMDWLALVFFLVIGAIQVVIGEVRLGTADWIVAMWVLVAILRRREARRCELLVDKCLVGWKSLIDAHDALLKRYARLYLQKLSLVAAVRRTAKAMKENRELKKGLAE